MPGSDYVAAEITPAAAGPLLMYRITCASCAGPAGSGGCLPGDLLRLVYWIPAHYPVLKLAAVLVLVQLRLRDFDVAHHELLYARIAGLACFVKRLV